MTERELIDKQNINGGDVFYLLKVGMFYHAYDNGAFALAGLMNYSVRRKRRKELGEILVSGFPVQSLPKVINRIEEEKGIVEKVDDGLYAFSGICFSTDFPIKEEPEYEYKKSKTELYDNLVYDIIREVDSFEIGNSTPIDALLFIQKIQSKIRNGNVV